jgi:CubicO group peptidase (beta-lactamase class C family)
VPAAEALVSLLAGSSAPAGAVVGVTGPDGRDVAAGGLTRPGGEPVGEHTRFDLASVTKAVTTCGLHRLAVLGEIALDDPLSRYLTRTPCTPGTTLVDLLEHRAGLWEWQPLYLTPDPLDTLASLPLRYLPRQARHYSDLGFMLLGQVVAAVAAAPLAAAVRSLVAEPLGLAGPVYGPVRSAVAAGGMGDEIERAMVRTGKPYPVLFDEAGFPWRDAITEGEVSDGNAAHSFAGVSGHAGLFGTVDDLLTLASSLACPNTTDLWGTHMRTRMFTDGPDDGQALGWRSQTVTYRGRLNPMLWHPGFTGCAVGFLPGEETAIVMLSNRLFAHEPAETASLWTRVIANL